MGERQRKAGAYSADPDPLSTNSGYPQNPEGMLRIAAAIFFEQALT
jgi:hypothetical protein